MIKVYVTADNFYFVVEFIKDSENYKILTINRQWFHADLEYVVDNVKIDVFEEIKGVIDSDDEIILEINDISELKNIKTLLPEYFI